MFNIDKTDPRASAALRRMARGMCVRLRIQEGAPLTFLIGDGTAGTNESAIAEWLAHRDPEPSPEVFEDACSELEQELARVLDGQ
jgi:hypothetical protein